MALFNVIVVPLPLQVNEWTASLYDYIDTLNPDDNVLVCTNLGAGQLAECYDSCVIVLKHLASRGCNLVEISTGGPWGGGMTNIPIGLRMWAEAFGVDSVDQAPEYGESIVFLGYLPGEYGGSSTISFTNDIRSIYDKDYFGTPISTFSFMDDIRNIHDFSLVMGLGASYTGIDVYTTAEWTIPAGWATTAQYTADIAASYRIGRYTGAIIGTHGGAEYELLLENPGRNMLRLSAIFMVCVTLFVLIAASNIRYVLLPKLTGGSSSETQGGR
ncbi:hypothetical protein AC480_06025 [miscellaneous Crenarchaeota group archaeon SMTZ1-55]|nr:MAG: hypothetical protein AC480_06025 [miscellaneous Crenarchaeota group archaeon SMTZ1-55]